jgi:hypothetical protein
MPLKVEAYLDSRGKLHQTLDAAVIADLAHEVFGSTESMAPSLAQKVLAKRADIELIFASYDVALKPETLACPIPSAPTLKATTATIVPLERSISAGKG